MLAKRTPLQQPVSPAGNERIRQAHSSVIDCTYAIVNTTGASIDHRGAIGTCACACPHHSRALCGPTSHTAGRDYHSTSCPDRSRALCAPAGHAAGRDSRSTSSSPDPDCNCALCASAVSRTAGRDSRSPAAAERVAGGSRDVGG